MDPEFIPPPLTIGSTEDHPGDEGLDEIELNMIRDIQATRRYHSGKGNANSGKIVADKQKYFPGGIPPDPIYLGNGKVKLPGDNIPVIVTAGSQIRVLEYLVEHGAATYSELQTLEGCENPTKVVTGLHRVADGKLKPFISKPGKKQQGGYKTVIVSRGS